MDLASQLQRQFVDYSKTLILEKGFLDDQFKQLQKLQDESNPEFVFEVVSLFFEDSEKLLNDLANALQQKIVDYKKVMLMSTSSRVVVPVFDRICVYVVDSIGAQRVKNVCAAFRNSCEARNFDGCKVCLRSLTEEYNLVKSKLETLFTVSTPWT
ncbi:hypothetical protein C3L33_07535, partial [Rhododendron williamsianum]